MRDVIIHSKSPRLKMWAAACLKRLLSDFHNTPDGTYSSNSRIIQNNYRSLSLSLSLLSLSLSVCVWVCVCVFLMYFFCLSRHLLISCGPSILSFTLLQL